MVAICACGKCNGQVALSGHYRKACRRRIEAAGGVCPRNVGSAGQKLYNSKHRPAMNLKNNLKNSEIRKLALRAANLQAEKFLLLNCFDTLPHSCLDLWCYAPTQLAIFFLEVRFIYMYIYIYIYIYIHIYMYIYI